MLSTDAAATLISAIRARGSDATTLRDAAHEAHHALVAKVLKGSWERERIHAALTKYCGGTLGHLVAQELDARAVEQIVCQRLGVDCGTIDHWAAICWMETIKSIGVALPSPAWVAACVRQRMQRPTMIQAAERVMRLADKATGREFKGPRRGARQLPRGP